MYTHRMLVVEADGGFRVCGEQWVLVPEDASRDPDGIDGPLSREPPRRDPQLPARETNRRARSRQHFALVTATCTGGDDVAVDPAGHVAHVVLSAAYHPAELTAVDLATGERTRVVGLCGGAGAFGAITSSADGETLTVVGSCIDADDLRTTAFVIG